MAPRRGRRFWERVVRELERGGASHADVAARHGVLVSTLRSWVYRLRRERRAATSAVRMLPVEIAPASEPARAAIEVRIATGDVVAFESGTDVAYVAKLVAALRGGAC